MVNRVLEFFPQRLGVFGCDPRDEHILFAFDELARDGDDLGRSFARAEDDFGESLPQRAMCVHLREAKVCYGRSLKRAQHFIAPSFSSAEIFQQSCGFNSRHPVSMSGGRVGVTRENPCERSGV